MKEINELQQLIVSCAKENSSDIIGFGSANRFRDSEVFSIYPGTKTVIGMAFRVLRGSHRGIEEGTTYYQYTTGIETIEEIILPMALLRICGILEDHGYVAIPQKRNALIMKEEDDTNPEMDYKEIYRGIQAEHQMDFNTAAVMCGLGELGHHGALLTDKFGPLQRVCFILTDAPLNESPLIIPHLCDRCGDCIRACPGNALSETGQRNKWQCAAYYMGANIAKNPFMPPEAFDSFNDREGIISGKAELTPEQAREVIDNIIFYPPVKHGYVSSICGRACDMACYIHLEEKGILTNRFHKKFRCRPEWKLTKPGMVK